MTKAKVGGYRWQSELVRARNANRTARQAMRRIVDEDLGKSMVMVLSMRVVQALSENLDALVELERICNHETYHETHEIHEKRNEENGHE